MERTKPIGLCSLEGCYTHTKNKTRKYCSKECHKQAIGAGIPICRAPECNERVKRRRNEYCSYNCYKSDNNTNAHSTCQRAECGQKLLSRKSTRKYCSHACYKLDHPNRPSRKVIRICTLPDCGKQIKRRGNGRKYCSLTCSTKAKKTLKPICCPTCDNQFDPKRFKQIFCSDKCRRGEVKLSIKKFRGIPRRFTKVNNKWVLTANLTWQAKHGDVTPGMDVWFLDSNTFNDMDVNNLYLVEHKEYLKIIRKVIHSDKEPMVRGNYEGREEVQSQKEELFDYNQEYL